MNDARREEVGERHGVAIVEAEVHAAGWQEIDLRLMFARLPASAIGAELGTLSGRWSAIAPTAPPTNVALFPRVMGGRLAAVPGDAFVKVGRVGRRGGVRRASWTARPIRLVANDNLTAPRPRSMWRDIFFLAVLAATVIGAFWSGRVHGLQKVIVVPAPMSMHSVIT